MARSSQPFQISNITQRRQKTFECSWEGIDECSGYEKGVKLSELPCVGCKTRMYSDWSRFDEQVDKIHDLGNTSCRRMTTRAVAKNHPLTVRTQRKIVLPWEN